MATFRENLNADLAAGGRALHRHPLLTLAGLALMTLVAIGIHNAEQHPPPPIRVEIVTPGMVVGQDLGITLDMENWWMRAHAKGIVQSTDLVPMGLTGPGDDGRGELTLLHHPTGQNQTRRPDWVVLAVPPNPVEWLYRDLKAAGVSVSRAGDCVAPRRAHAAIVDGERAGATL